MCQVMGIQYIGGSMLKSQGTRNWPMKWEEGILKDESGESKEHKQYGCGRKILR